MAITKIKKSQIDSLAIVNADIDASAAIASSKLADGANFVKKDGSVAFTANQSFGNFKATNVGDPVSATDAANKQYVDSIAQGLSVKTAVRVATTANITLSGTQTIDGVVLSAGDRVLVKNQTTTTENGVYDVSGGAWSRSTDSDTGVELVNAFYFVTLGTTLQATGWTQSTPGPITIGSTAIVFNQFSGAADYQAGNGLTKSGLTFNVGTASASRIVVNADDIDLATTGVTAGTYNRFTVDAYGRITSATAGTTDNLVEGGSNLFFTNARAQAAVTGGASSIVSTNLTASRALVSDASGKVVVSAATASEVGFLSGVTSAIQTQLNTRQPLDATLSALAATITAADTMIYFTGVDTAQIAPLTAFGRGVMGAVDAAAGRSALGVIIGTDVQAYDPDLGAIAALSGTSGFLKKTAANTWSLDTNTYLTGNQSITLSGDVTGTGATGIAVTLANSGVTAGTYGSATQVPAFTVDAKGRITGVTNTAINLISALSGLSDVTLSSPADGQLLRYSGGGTNKWVNWTPNFITGNQTITVSGDATGSGTTSLSLTLANTGTAGTYTKVTTDAKGRVTAGTTLSAGDLPSGTINISNIVTRETPSPLPNGVNTTFTVTGACIPGTEHVYLNGVLMEPGAGNDYIVTLASPFTINFLFAPTSTDKIRISYIKP